MSILTVIIYVTTHCGVLRYDNEFQCDLTKQNTSTVLSYQQE